MGMLLRRHYMEQDSIPAPAAEKIVKETIKEQQAEKEKKTRAKKS